MFAAGYSRRVKTIEVVRMENYRRLVTELQGDGDSVRPADIARALGISKVYAWQLENAKREAIDSRAARTIERHLNKPVGWMDTDFDLWPFPDLDLLARITELDHDQRVEIQGIVRKHLLDLEAAPTPRDRQALREASASSMGRKTKAHRSQTRKQG